MPDSSARVFEIFAWEHRDTVFLVAFEDGEEYELTRVTAGQDDGEPAHGTASVVRSVRTSSGKPFPEASAMFFRLSDVTAVADATTGEILYRAS